MWSNLFDLWMMHMGDLATYLFATTLVLIFLYAPYTLLLRKEHFFRQNRLRYLPSWYSP